MIPALNNAGFLSRKLQSGYPASVPTENIPFLLLLSRFLPRRVSVELVPLLDLTNDLRRSVFPDEGGKRLNINQDNLCAKNLSTLHSQPCIALWWARKASNYTQASI
jgi:hypothetical protein